MAMPSTITPRQADLIKTAAAIVYVVDDSALHDALQQSTPLNQEQISILTHRFSDGLDRWDREVKTHHAPNYVDISRIAISASVLDQRYPQAVRRDSRGEITIQVQDLIDCWHALASDPTQYEAPRQLWEGLVHQMFGSPATQSRNPRIDQSIKGAEQVGKKIADSIGLGGLFNSAIDAGEVPHASVPALPVYAADDERSKHPDLMARLLLELSVTEGLLVVLTPDPHEDHANHVMSWFQERANTAIGTVSKLVIPSGIARYSSQMQDSLSVLRQSRDILRTTIYGTEPEVASAAAQWGVERSLGTILFLAVCPNIPFIIPTLELRLAFTKPIYFLTRGAHEALGDIPIFGFPIFLLRLLGQLLDAIPRTQVRLVQSFVTEGWLTRSHQRARVVRRYLNYAEKRATKPRIDALQRVLLSIVS